MSRNWQEASVGAGVGRWAALYATMNPKGVIHISHRTYEKLGEPEAFRLLFDAANATIGMQPTRRVSKNSYPTIKKNPDRGRIVRAWAFYKEFKIKLHETVRFTDAEIDSDGILVLDLRRVASAAKPKRLPTSKPTAP